MLHSLVIQTFQLTPDFTNSVFLAMLPLVSGASTALHICRPCEFRPDEVRSYQVEDRHDPRGSISLSAGHYFHIEHGYVELYDSSRSYFNILDDRQASNFVGELKLTRDEAIAIARDYTGAHK